MIADFSAYANVSPAVLAFCFVSITLGAAVQRLAGQGFGLISTPLVALVAPQMLPSAILLLGLASGLGSSALDFRDVVKSDLPWGFAGRFAGAVIAAQIAVMLPGFEEIAVLIAVIVLLAVGLNLSGLSVPITRATLAIAGLTAGIMGTLTAIGAPPMALLYQTEEPGRSRASQSTFFFFGMIVSISALAWKGLITPMHLKFALVTSPAILLGLLVSQPLARHFSKRMVRPIALWLSSLAAIILLAKAVFF